MAKGRGGPHDGDTRDREILSNMPDVYPVYFDGHGKFRISKAIELDLNIKKVSHTVSTLVEAVTRIVATMEAEKEWKQAGEKTARGRLSGRKKKAVSTSNS